MPTFSLTIGGAAKDIKRGSLEIRKTANGRGTAKLVVISTDGSYRPALDAEVIVTIDGTRVFGGLVDRPSEKGVFDGGPNNSIVTTVNCYDFHHYADRRFVDGTLAAGTLKSKVTTLIADYLSVFGVTLHGSQVDGPSLPAQEFNFVRLSDVFNELVAMTADFGQPYVWRIDDFKVLRFFQPSTVSAPFNLTSSATQVEGDLEVEVTRDHYANRVFLKVPAKRQDGRIESFSGDGSTTTFTLEYTPTNPNMYGHILVGSGGAELLGETGTLDGNGNPVAWWYDPDTNQITRNAGASVNGETYNLYFDGIFEGTATSEDASASTSPWEKVVVVEEVPEDTTAQALADGYLAAALPTTKRVRYRTREGGLLPGQSQSVVVPKRNLNATLIITDVVIKDWLSRHITYDVTAVFDAQTNLDRGWQDQYKVWRGDKLGSSAAGASNVSLGAGAGTPTNGVGAGRPAPPFKSNQFNDSGAFGGHECWTFDKTTSTVMIGTDHQVGGGDNLLIGEGHTVL